MLIQRGCYFMMLLLLLLLRLFYFAYFRHAAAAAAFPLALLKLLPIAAMPTPVDTLPRLMAPCLRRHAEAFFFMPLFFHGAMLMALLLFVHVSAAVFSIFRFSCRHVCFHAALIVLLYFAG